MAEWSKAPDLSSGTRESAWVRTPHLATILGQVPVIQKLSNTVSLLTPLTVETVIKKYAGYCLFYILLKTKQKPVKIFPLFKNFQTVV